MRGHFTAIFEALHINVNNKWNAIDGSYIRAHQHSAGGKGGPRKTLSASLAAAVPRRSMRVLMHKGDRYKLR